MTDKEELENLYIKIGSDGYQITDADMEKVEELENKINPPADPFVYKCPNCGSEWCSDPTSWDCIAASQGSPMDV